MTPTNFVGIDISKLTLDVAVIKEGIHITSLQIENSEPAIRNLLSSIQSTYQCTAKNTLYCAEHMGLYAKFLQDVLYRKKVRFCLESPLRIRLSLGLQRGKTDALDAIRIADYARKNVDSLKLWCPPRPCVEKLRMLMSLRKNLIKIGAMLKNRKKLQEFFLPESELAAIGKYNSRIHDVLRADLKRVEKDMATIIRKDPELHRLVQIVSSVPHIGVVIATELIIVTNEFKDFTCPKRFASYCGLAPFGKSSGTSIRRRPRTSRIANKDMKTMFHLASLGSTRAGDTVFKVYYRRKVAEGKHRMSVLNAVRNKMVRVIFACVREGRLYEEPCQS
jgi:transposase